MALIRSKLEPNSEQDREILQENESQSSSNMPYLNLPSTMHDVQKLALKGIKHPGMRMLSNSLRAHRSSNKAIIFLYGMTGSGKSSTLNHLFNNLDMLKVSDYRSCTKDVVEYVVTMTSDDCRVHNLEIGFIDTPGWGDTDGTIQDAVNLSSIATFLQMHPLLSSKSHSLFPNIVLIVVSAVDKRLGGEFSNCAYMLRALSKLHVVDKSRPNVVFVLTNASSVPKGRYKCVKKYKTDQIQVMCRQYLGISSPVVWIENDFVGNELERDGDWTFLFDREKQPLNLFEAMISLFTESRDDIGLEAVRMCFSGNCSNLLNPKPGLSVPGRAVCRKGASKVVELNDQEMNWHLSIIKELKLLVNTEVTQELREYTNSHKDIARFEEMVPMLTYLQESGITKLSELEKRTLYEIESMLKPFLINRTDKFILLEVFKVHYKSFLDIVQVVGCGYNTENRSISDLRIFDIKTLDCEFDYNVGIYIPKCIDTTLIQYTTITCVENDQPAHDTDTHNTEVVPARIFGFEIIHNLYTFETNKHLAKINHNQGIVKSIQELPTSAIDNSNTVTRAYSDFFRIYGNLEIHSAVVSGRISGCVTMYNSSNQYIVERQICAILENKITAIKENNIQNDVFLEVDFDVDNVPLEFVGGDQSHYCPTINQLTHEKWNAWVDSILSNPIFHPDYYGMSPIYNLVKTIDSNKGNEMQIAYDTVYKNITHRLCNPLSNIISDKEPDRLREAKSRLHASNIAKHTINHSNTNNGCFPGNARVELRGGERVRMDELKIGDHVLSIHPTTGKPVYSRVYLWAHRDTHITATFLHITHPHGHLHISASHLILSGDQRRPVPADQLRVGDSIHFLSPCLSQQQQQQQLDGKEEGERGDSHTLISVPVLRIHTCTQVGYYAPFTMNSYILVDGIAASVFSVTEQSMSQFAYFQTIGQSLFYPMRLLDRLGFGTIVGTYLDKDTKIHKYAQFLKGSYQLPSSPIEVNCMMKTNYHHGMRMVQASLNAQRACNEAIIFVYGQTGAGKTSSLNHLFDSEIIPKSKRGISDTHSVSEYMSVMSSPKWEVTNLEIGFIDLPGWGDTHGDAQDARNLAAIEQFTMGHRHLGSRLYKCYPNIILIVFNVMEERLEGPESNAARMLRMLNELRVVDIKHPNVVVVLTHAMSLPPLIFQESLRDIERIIKTLTKTFLKVEARVVYVENNTSGFPLKKEGEWTVLADGTLQPINLFDAMIDLMTESGDEVGVEAVRLYFRDRGSNKPIELRKVETNCVPRTAEEKWRAIIILNNKKMTDTEVLRRIKVYRREHPDIAQDRLLPLSFELNKAGFMKIADFESLNVDEVESYLEPYLLGELEKKILMEVFGVKSRTLPDLVNSVGRGFDIEHHCFLHPILKPMTDYYITNGVNVPTCMRAVPLEELMMVCKVEELDDKDTSFKASKPPSLHMESKDNCQQKLKPVSLCPISPITSEAKYFPEELSIYKFIFTITRNVMNIEFVIHEELIKQVSEEFIQDINELPLNFTLLEEDTIAVDVAYEQFFKKYGQYFVLGCKSGGRIIGELNLKCRDQDVIQTKAIVQQYVSAHLATLQSTTDKNEYKFDDELFNKILQAPLSWEGGIKPEFCESLRDISSELWHVWIKSLKQKSNILTDVDNNLRLIPIYQFASCISKPISERLKEAISVLSPGLYLFDTEFTIEQTPIPEDSIHDEGFGANRRRTQSRSKQTRSVPTLTRNLASDEADTGTSDCSKGGFPGNAKVRKRGVNGGPIEVNMDTIKEGDYLLCANSQGKVNYEIISHMKKEAKKKVIYLIISDNVDKVTIGYKHRIVHGGLSSATVAEELKLGHRIYSVAFKANEVKPTTLLNIGIIPQVGNYIPIMEKGNIIVNGIVCENPDNCFPGNASVVLRGGERVRMDELKIGDHVLSIHPTTGKPVYSRVYLWAHRDTHITATFLHITHPHGHLHISASHLILSGDQRRPVPADQLRVGDSIHFLSPCLSQQQQQQQQQLDGKEEEGERGDSHTLISVPVLHIHTCTQVGYYAPFTNNGFIVVDGIAASVYSHLSTHSQSDSSSSSWLWSGVCRSVTRGLVHQFGMHRVGQCVLTPVRVACKLGAGSVLSRQMDTNTHIHKYCQWLLDTFNPSNIT